MHQGEPIEDLHQRLPRVHPRAAEPDRRQLPSPGLFFHGIGLALQQRRHFDGGHQFGQRRDAHGEMDVAESGDRADRRCRPHAEMPSQKLNFRDRIPLTPQETRPGVPDARVLGVARSKPQSIHACDAKTPTGRLQRSVVSISTHHGRHFRVIVDGVSV